MRARVSPPGPPTSRRGATWEALREPGTARRGASFCCRPTTLPATRAGRAAGDIGSASTPLGAVAADVRADPGSVRVPPGATYVDSRVDRPARGAAPASARTSSTSACPAAPPRDRGAIRVRLPVRGAGRRRRQDESVEVDTHAWLEALLPARRRRAGVGRRRPDQPRCSRARTTSRSATAATTPTCRRSRASTAARRRGARRERHDDAFGGDQAIPASGRSPRPESRVLVRGRLLVRGRASFESGSWL